jgi:hypothetical protein
VTQNPPSTTEPTNLRDALAFYFSSDELDLLLAGVGVNADDVPGRGKERGVRANEILLFCERRSLLAKLIAECQRQRSEVQWQALLDAHVRSSLQGFIHDLSSLMNDPPAREIILLFRNDFEEANAHIATISLLKQTHDEFQELERCYKQIDLNHRVVPGDIRLLRSMVTDAQSRIGKLQELAAIPVLAQGSARWTQPLAEAKRHLQTASAQREQALSSIESACEALKESLDRGPSKINIRLVQMVDVLLQSGLIARMEQLRDRLTQRQVAGLDPEKYAAGLGALAQMRDRLVQLKTEHYDWQDVDDDLNMIEIDLGRDSGNLTRVWPNLSESVQRLVVGKRSEWAVKLVEIGPQLGAALQSQTMDDIVDRFDDYRRNASYRFHEVDDELLDVCAELQRIGKDLSGLLAKMN